MAIITRRFENKERRNVGRGRGQKRLRRASSLTRTSRTFLLAFVIFTVLGQPVVKINSWTFHNWGCRWRIDWVAYQSLSKYGDWHLCLADETTSKSVISPTLVVPSFSINLSGYTGLNINFRLPRGPRPKTLISHRPLRYKQDPSLRVTWRNISMTPRTAIRDATPWRPFEGILTTTMLALFATWPTSSPWICGSSGQKII